MAIISYIRECRSFIAYASDHQLSANEFVLWHAFLNLFNAYANGNAWPDGYIPASNNKLLSLTTFRGAKRDETLRLTRDRLVSRGLIDYKKGSRNAANPQYKMVYFAPDMPDALPDDDFTPNKKGNIGVNTGGNLGVNIGDIYTDLDEDGDVDPDLSDGTHNAMFPAAALGARGRGNKPWYDPERPDADCDTAYLQSGAARAAIAQRILDYCAENGMLRNSDNIHLLICDCLKKGMHPSVIQRQADGAKSTQEYGYRLFEAAKANGTPLYNGRAMLFDKMVDYGLLSQTGG